MSDMLIRSKWIRNVQKNPRLSGVLKKALKYCIFSPRAGGFRALAKAIRLVLLAAAVVGGRWAATASPAQRNWTGSASENWSNPGNWNPAGVPQNGEKLVFLGDGSLTTFNIDSVNDMTGLVVAELDFGDGITAPLVSPNFHVSGNPLTVTSGMEVSVPSGGFDSRMVTISCDLNLANTPDAPLKRFDVSTGQDGRNVLLLSGAITLNNTPLLLEAGGSGRRWWRNQSHRRDLRDRGH